MQHVLTTVPAPPLFVDKNRASSEILASEAQRVIGNINMAMAPVNVRFAFDLKYYVNCDMYSVIFGEELKRVVTHYYEFYHYDVVWDGDLLHISWASVSSRDPVKGYIDVANGDDGDLSDVESPSIKKVARRRSRFA